MAQRHDNGKQKSASVEDSEICPCQDGMHLDVDLSRRRMLMSTAAIAAVPAQLFASSAIAETKTAPPGAVLYDVPDDPTKVMGRALLEDGGYGTRSQFETAVRARADNPNDMTSWSYTPLADMKGNLTPSGLHYERHHGGIPAIDPAKHFLYVHGMVDEAKKFSIADILRLPSITRRYFIECSGNTYDEWAKPKGKNVQVTHGLLSTSEWTGVPFATFARHVGLKDDASWVLGEGADAAVMTRSIPLDKMLTDGLIAYGQNGEMIRPEQGYPLRLVVPGYEGNMMIKWLRRLQVSDRPFMTREETGRYTGLMPNGRARQFYYSMDAKSVITFPSGEMLLPKPGHYEIRGIAWSGRGRVQAVDISMDGGKNWIPARIDDTPEAMSSVRFSCPWFWDGKPAILQSRCIEDSGYVQPTRTELIRLRGDHFFYHYNAIQSWAVAADGSVSNVHV